MQLHIWSASLTSCCCLLFALLLKHFSFFSEPSLLGCCCFFWALGYYAWKLCSQKKMHLKHLINFFPFASRRAHIRKAQQRNFTLLSPRKCPGRTYAHFNNLLHKIIQRCYVQYVHAALLTPSRPAWRSPRESKYLNPPFETWWLKVCNFSTADYYVIFGNKLFEWWIA